MPKFCKHFRLLHPYLPSKPRSTGDALSNLLALSEVRRGRPARCLNERASICGVARIECQEFADGERSRRPKVPPKPFPGLGRLRKHRVRSPKPSGPDSQIGATSLASDDEILQAFGDDVRRFCRSRTQSTHDGEDAAQETFSRFLKRTDRLLRDPKAWLFRTASLVCLELGRKNRRRPEADLAISDEDTRENDPEAMAMERAWLTEFFSKLSDGDRNLLGALYLRGMSIDEVAGSLKISNGNVRVMALRARRRAQRLITAMAGEVGAR